VEDGFTRTANPLVEAFARTPLTSREARIIRVVERLTYGWQRPEARITVETFSKMTGLPESKASEAVSSLLRRKVLVRAGGSRSPVKINKRVREWDYSDHQARVSPKRPEDPKRGESHQDGETEIHQDGEAYKERKDIPPLPSVEGEGPSPDPEPKAKPAKASPKAKPTQLDLSNLPADVTVEAVQGFIEHRKALKKPLTQRALNLNVNEALRAAERIPGMTADQALDETVMTGWQAVKADWLARRQGATENPAKGMNPAERLHAANQQAIREAVERRNADAEGNGDLFDNDGGHW